MLLSVAGTLFVTGDGTGSIRNIVAKAAGTATGTAQSKGLSTDEQGKLSEITALLETRFYKDVDHNALVNGAINGMVASLGDPYSVYMSKEEAQSFSSNVEGSFSGIGAEVTLEEGRVTVVSPIKGSPAEKAGIMAKDRVMSVNGESLDGLTLNEAVAKIRGPKGTKLTLVIMRDGSNEPITLEVVRDDVDVETVFAEMRDSNVGLIEIRQFSANTAERFATELAGLEKKGMQGLVIDVRNNPGGILQVVNTIAAQFVPKGETIVQVEERSGAREKTVSPEGGGKDYPIALLINKGSASASEVLAGALREKAGAVLVGENSFGKGTVQVPYDNFDNDGSMLKMTIAKWLTPDGNWVHEKGIKPDVAVAQPEYYTVLRLTRDKELKFDAVSDDVKNMQIMLGGLGYKVDRKDGYFSKKTEDIVKTFQKEKKLSVTGIVDNKTADALENALRTKMLDKATDVQLSKAVDKVKAMKTTAKPAA
jgi:carboxyl-terminal processing protease